MHSKRQFVPVPMLLLLPVLILCLAGCLSTQTARSVETRLVSDVCRAWPIVTYSSKDTEQTKREAEAAYRARIAFGCPK